MSRKILCATDGTDHAATAVVHAAESAAREKADLILCLVNVMHGGGRGPMISNWTDEQADEILNEAEALAKHHGAPKVHRVVVKSREAASGVVGYAEANGIDRIVTGTGDKRGLSRLVLGSVAGDIAGRAHCSVTVAR